MELGLNGTGISTGTAPRGERPPLHEHDNLASLSIAGPGGRNQPVKSATVSLNMG
jgi:hypothetical protein